MLFRSIFVLEELQHGFSASVFGTALISAVTADVVMRTVSGQRPEFIVPTFPAPPLSSIPLFLGLGVLCGLLGAAFNKGIMGTLRWFDGWSASRPAWVPGALAGVFAGIVGWWMPYALGGGHDAADAILAGEVALAVVPLLFLAKFAVTMISYGCGVPGGIFAPLLVLGALTGFLVGQVSHTYFPMVATHPAAFAAVGMAAFFASIVRAPLTGVVLILEMTQNYQQMLSLLLACLAAYAVAELLGVPPIYESLLERDLAHNTERPDLGETLMIDLTIEPGSRYDGILVREMGLPQGCILAMVRRGLHEFVPGGNTRLEAGDRITALVSSEAAEAIARLRELVRTRTPA